MSKATETKEIYSVCKQNVHRYFDETEKNVAQYLQAVTNLQQECATACKNTIENAIAMQQEYVSRTGMSTHDPSGYL